jgi:hypothetical protein
LSNSLVCQVCGSTKHPAADYCKRCRRIIDRRGPRRERGDALQKPNKKARLRALKQAWDGERFRCYYSKIRLIEDNSKDPRYRLTFDHRIPRQESDVVVAAAAINDMKSDMTEIEFKEMVIQLASRFKGGSFDEGVFNLKHWKR